MLHLSFFFIFIPLSYLPGRIFGPESGETEAEAAPGIDILDLKIIANINS